MSAIPMNLKRESATATQSGRVAAWDGRYDQALGGAWS